MRILGETLRRRKRRAAVGALAVAIGASLAAALLVFAATVAEKMGRELRAYGANILVTPQAQELQIAVGGISYRPEALDSYLNEEDLPQLKTVFWRHNIVGFAPYLSLLVAVGEREHPAVLTGTWFERELSLPTGTRLRTSFAAPTASSDRIAFKTGVKAIAPWWRVQGDWVADGDMHSALVGVALAQRLALGIGDPFTVRYGDQAQALRVVGLLGAGGLEDEQIFVSLPVAQKLLGLSRGASYALVSALVTPREKAPPDIRDKNPQQMTPKEYEKWYCTPLIDSVIAQIKEALPGAEAKPIRQISEAEGAFLIRIELLMLLMAGVALAASALGVMATVTTAVIERRGEMGLMKALGADNGQIALLFLAEASLIGLIGGSVGYLGGLLLARLLSAAVFAAPLSPHAAVLPATLGLGVGVALLGSALPVRQAMAVEPISLLRRG